jgi:hypothetical protein
MSKTHFKKLRNPNYIGAWDLMDENGKITNLVVTISDTKKEMVFDGNGKQEECVVFYFTEKKPMVMNATNLKTISKVLDSPFIEDWRGKQIELTVKKVKAFGEVHDALRVVNAKPTEIKIDTESYIKLINETKSIEDLQKVWTSLPLNVMKTQEVINAKDKKKNDFSH